MVRVVLIRLLETFFRHKWLYLFIIPVMAVAGLAYSLLSTPVFISGGRLFVQDSTLIAEFTQVRQNNGLGSFYLTAAEITVEQFNELFKSDSYIRAVVKDTNLEARMNLGQEEVDKVLEEVREAVWAATDSGSALGIGGDHVVVLAKHEDPEVAFQLVQGVIDNFLDWNINRFRSESVDTAEFFAGKVQSYRVDLDLATSNMRDYLETHPEPLRGDRPELELLDIGQLQSEVEIAKLNYEDALLKFENANIASEQASREVEGTYTLLDAPRVAEKPDRSITSIAKDVIIFGALGTMLMMLVVLGSALIDRSIRFPIDIETRTELPVLTTIPQASEGRRRRFGRGKKKGKKSSTPGYYQGYA